MAVTADKQDMEISSMIYRKATLNDLSALCQIRKKQLIDEGIEPSVSIDSELTAYFRTQMENGTLVEWLAESEEKIIATAAIAFISFPPTYTNKSGIKGYITNMYTDPACRGQGIAAKMLTLLCREARERNVQKIFLHASDMGYSVYERCGFKTADRFMEMDV